MLSAIPAYYFLCNSLDDAKGLSEDDKSYMRERILHDGPLPGLVETEFKKQYIWDAFKDFKVGTTTAHSYAEMILILPACFCRRSCTSSLASSA